MQIEMQKKKIQTSPYLPVLITGSIFSCPSTSISKGIDYRKELLPFLVDSSNIFE